MNLVLMQLIKKRIVQANFYSAPQFVRAMFKIVRGVEVIQNHLDAYINGEYKLLL